MIVIYLLSYRFVLFISTLVTFFNIITLFIFYLPLTSEISRIQKGNN